MTTGPIKQTTFILQTLERRGLIAATRVRFDDTLTICPNEELHIDMVKSIATVVPRPEEVK